MAENLIRHEFGCHLGHVCAFAHVCVDGCRHHGHHMNAFFRKVGAHCLTERQQRSLTRAICADNRQIDFGECGGHVHDHSLAAFEHRRRQRACHAQGAEVIHVHFFSRRVKTHRSGIAVTGHTCVVHEHVDRAE